MHDDPNSVAIPSDPRTVLPAVPPVGDGDGFVFDPEEITAVLAEWEQLRDDLVEDAARAEDLSGVVGPGREPASENMAHDASWSGGAFTSHNDSMLNFVQVYIDNLTKARDQYLGQDDASRGNFGGS